MFARDRAEPQQRDQISESVRVFTPTVGHAGEEVSANPNDAQHCHEEIQPGGEGWGGVVLEE